MTASELKAAYSIKMLELENAIDLGMPYPKVKEVYNQLKELQYQLALAEIENNKAGLVLE
ncbi:MAG TPA: hypothetical protein VHK91_02895 [Flavisolibacter sp.]|jgi:hypothetical protein|nr:hypothetical protein [Flavisolibacter sp.]